MSAYRRETDEESGMIQKPLADIGPDDIQALIDNEVIESRTLDYKQTLPHPHPQERVSFLKDVCAFANTDGGDLLFGIAERKEGGTNTGIPESVVGLSEYVHDPAVRRLDEIVRNGLKPRLMGVRYKELNHSAGQVLLMRIERGFNRPHIVAGDEMRFWGRDSMSNFILDADQLRRLFLGSTELPTAICRFRTERNERIMSGETPFRLWQSGKVVLHILPLRAFELGATVDVTQDLTQLVPLGARSWDGRFNLDGYVSCSETIEQGVRAYTQLFRNGCIEAVDSGLLLTTDERRKILAANGIVEYAIPAVKRYIKLLESLGCPGPYAILLSLLGVHEYYIPDLNGFSERKVDRPILLLPDVLISEHPQSYCDALRPVFDSLWQASGWRQWQSYSEAKKLFE